MPILLVQFLPAAGTLILKVFSGKLQFPLRKLAILKDGFRQLEADRKELEQKRHRLSREWTSSDSRLPGPAAEEAVKRLFHSAGNQLALRKRYRDLVKIFHPDNLFGDEELVQMINREYLRRKCDE